MEPLHEVEPDEILGNGQPALRDGAWNQVRLSRNDSHIVVAVNGKLICRFAISIDQRFGFLGEQDRNCRVREVTLTGPWPKQLPELFVE